MEHVNTNRITATKLIDRALSAADLANTDFLSYEDKTQFINDAFKNVYQQIINYNLNVFTVEATLIGAGGVYKLPWDCYQIKSVKNPYSGVEILRKADSQGMFGSYYEVVNDTIRLGPSCGPITVTYWRKPFFLSIPNKTIDTGLTLGDRYIEDVCKSSVLLRNNSGDKIWIYNLLTQSELEISVDAYTSSASFKLGNNFFIKIKSSKYSVFGFDGTELYHNITEPTAFIKSDDGLLYPAISDDTENTVSIYNVGSAYTEEPIKVITYSDDEGAFGIVCIDGEFYKTQAEDPFPIGIFDDKPAYTADKSLCLITDKGEIHEQINIASIGNIYQTQYGFLTFDGKLHSNIPDTELNFPNNTYFEVLSYDLAIRFLCKQNADSSGCENLNKNAWALLTASIDNSADFARIKNVRR